MRQILQSKFQLLLVLLVLLVGSSGCNNENGELDQNSDSVEELPRFPGCEDEPGGDEAKIDCAKHKMLQFIYTNLKYPEEARQNKIEGICVLQFIIDVDGSITEAEIITDIGGGCGEAALEVVNSMNDLPERWIPGSINGENVRVLYSLPVRFKLEG